MAQLDRNGRHYNCGICETTVSLKAAGVLESQFEQIVKGIDMPREITVRANGDPNAEIFYNPQTGTQGIRSLT